MIEKVKKRQLGILIIVGIVSFLTTVIISLDTGKPEYYSLLPLLPLTFLLVNLIFLDVTKHIPKNIGITFIFILYFLRLVILPLIMYLGDYASLMKIGIEDNVFPAIFLMIYEVTVVYFVMYQIGRRYTYRNNLKVEVNYRKRKLNFFPVILMTLLGFIITIYIIFPESRVMYKTVFNWGDDDFTYNFYNHRDEVGSTLSRGLLTLYRLVLEMSLLVFPAYLMRKIKNRFNNILGILISVPLLIIPFLFISSTIAQSIITSVVLLLVIGRLYPNYANKINLISIAVTIIAVFSYFFTRFNTGLSRYGSGSIFEYFSSVSISYFTGIDNIGAIFNMGDAGKWESLFFNFYGAIPFNNTLFGLDGVNLQTIFNLYNNSMGQIPATISSGYYYFGFLFAPIFSIILVAFSTIYGFKAEKATNLWLYLPYVLLSMILAFGLVSYNETIALRWVTTLIIPLIIIGHLSKTYIKDTEFGNKDTHG